MVFAGAFVPSHFAIEAEAFGAELGDFSAEMPEKGDVVPESGFEEMENSVAFAERGFVGDLVGEAVIRSFWRLDEGGIFFPGPECAFDARA